MRPEKKKRSHHRHTIDPIDARVGARIRKFRQDKGFSFDAFVEEVQLGRGYVSELERGLVSPTVRTLAKISKTLGVTMADLVLGDSLRERLFEASRHLRRSQVFELVEEVEKREKDQKEQKSS